MCVLPQTEVLTHAVLLKDAAHVLDVDGGGAGLGDEAVWDAGGVVGGVAVGDVDSDLLLTTASIVCIAFHLGWEGETG